MSRAVESLAQPFVKAVEVWVPEGGILRHHSGAYGDASSFAQGVESLTFRSGEGLPGATFGARRPVVFSELDGRFVRRELAQLAGLDAGVAFPLFRGEEIIAVVVLLCGSREHTGGCIEVWEPNELRELAWNAGYYGRLERFAELSRLLRFQPGRGLPGIVWERGLPHIMPELGQSSSFVRAVAARASGVHAGLGVPLYRGDAIAQVLLLLSAHSTPLARAFEIWTVAEGGELSLTESFYAAGAQSPGRAKASSVERALATRVCETGLPWASASPHAELASALDPASAARFKFALGLPVHDGERLRAVVNVLN